MGLLDDAIREHLDLKRRRGADPTEIERAERDALGPVRRDPMGSYEADLEHAALPDDELGYEEEPPYEHSREEPARFYDPAATEPPVAPPPELEYTLGEDTEVWDEFEPDAPGLVDTPHRANASHPADSLPVEKAPPRVAEPLGEEPGSQPPPEPYAAPAPPPAQPREPLDVDSHATQPHAAGLPPAVPPPSDSTPADALGDTLGSDTAEHDMELEEIEGEDVLEETPEFLQDTPDHDRLWFEQRPPKDFDFDE
jgi:hypothetical protein